MRGDGVEWARSSGEPVASGGIRLPTRSERRALGAELPLLKHAPFFVVGDADGSVNCATAALGIPECLTWWVSGGARLSLAGITHGELAHVLEVEGFRAAVSADVAAIAVYGTPAAPLHLARRAGPLWRSKLGAGPDILHELGALERGSYGYVRALFAR